MPKSLRWAMVFWPGLTLAWQAGNLRALGICLGFVFALQAAWIGTFIWPGLLSGWESRLLWWSLAAWVAGSVLYQIYCAAWTTKAGSSICSDKVLQAAQSEYLRGNYFEAEELLTVYVSQGEWDVEAAMWLASIYRRTGRLEALRWSFKPSNLLNAGAYGQPKSPKSIGKSKKPNETNGPKVSKSSSYLPFAILQEPL